MKFNYIFKKIRIHYHSKENKEQKIKQKALYYKNTLNIGKMEIFVVSL